MLDISPKSLPRTLKISSSSRHHYFSWFQLETPHFLCFFVFLSPTQNLSKTHPSPLFLKNSILIFLNLLPYNLLFLLPENHPRSLTKKKKKNKKNSYFLFLIQNIIITQNVVDVPLKKKWFFSQKPFILPFGVLKSFILPSSPIHFLKNGS